MFKIRVALLSGLLALSMQSALADVKVSCVPEPEPLLLKLPEFQALDVETAKKRLANSLLDIKQYQSGLKSYRECLEKAGQTIQQKAAEDHKPVDTASLQKLDGFWNATVTQEERVVNEFNSLRASLCSRGSPEYCN